MARWRVVLDWITAVAVVAGVVVGVVTEPGGREDARAAAPLVSTSAPRQWPSPVDMAAPTTTPAVTAPATEPAQLTSAPTTAPATTTPPPTSVPWAPQLAAQLVSPVVYVFSQPGGGSPTEALPATTYFGNRLVLPVVQRDGDWLEVLLPTRPNSSEGWIRANDAALISLVDRVTVKISDRTLAWTHEGRVMLETTVAVGAPSSPTPVGSFFVTDVLPEDPASAYGGWIVALDGHSEAFSTYDDGDARIAIHGTNDPGSIGKATSSGCVRTDAGSLTALAHGLPLGTPVDIQP